MKLKLRLSAFFAFVLFSAATVACDDMELTLSADEKALLKSLHDKEEAAGITTALLKWGPAVTLLAANQAEAVLVVTTTDWESWAKSGANVKKITRCTQVQTIDYFDVESNYSSSDSKAFFACLRAAYDQGCG